MDLKTWAEQFEGSRRTLVVICGNETKSMQPESPQVHFYWNNVATTTSYLYLPKETCAVFVRHDVSEEDLALIAQHDADYGVDVTYELPSKRPLLRKIRDWVQVRESKKLLIVVPKNRLPNGLVEFTSKPRTPPLSLFVDEPFHMLVGGANEYDDVFICAGTSKAAQEGAEKVGRRVWVQDQDDPHNKASAHPNDVMLGGMRVPNPIVNIDECKSLVMITTTLDMVYDNACLVELWSNTIPISNSSTHLSLSPTSSHSFPMTIVSHHWTDAPWLPGRKATLTFGLRLTQGVPGNADKAMWRLILEEVAKRSAQPKRETAVIGTVAPGQDVPFGTPVVMGEDGKARPAVGQVKEGIGELVWVDSYAKTEHVHPQSLVSELAAVAKEWPDQPHHSPVGGSERKANDVGEVGERGWWNPTDGGLTDRLVKVLDVSMMKPFRSATSRHRMLVDDLLTELCNGPCELPSAKEIAACWHGTPYVAGIEGSEYQGNIVRSWLHSWFAPTLNALHVKMVELQDKLSRAEKSNAVANQTTTDTNPQPDATHHSTSIRCETFSSWNDALDAWIEVGTVTALGAAPLSPYEYDRVKLRAALEEYGKTIGRDAPHHHLFHITPQLLTRLVRVAHMAEREALPCSGTVAARKWLQAAIDELVQIGLEGRKGEVGVEVSDGAPTAALIAIKHAVEKFVAKVVASSWYGVLNKREMAELLKTIEQHTRSLPSSLPPPAIAAAGVELSGDVEPTLPTLFHVQDIEAFEGPILSEYRSVSGNVYVEKWCTALEKDGKKVGGRWLVVRVNPNAIADYVAKKITMLELLVEASDGVGFLVDRVGRVELTSEKPPVYASSMSTERVAVVQVSKLPEPYLPHPTARHDESLRPGGVFGAE